VWIQAKDVALTAWIELQCARARELLDQAMHADPPRLDWAALAISALENPAVDPEACELALDGYAERVRTRWNGSGHVFEGIQALRHVLGVEEGFRGHRLDDADVMGNSLLDRVIDRKVGLPITLSVIYLEVARRAGVPIYGVSFPGHFLLATDIDGTKLAMDPFAGGELLTETGCQNLLRKVAPQIRFQPKMLVPASVKVIASRMLNNLKRNYLEAGEHERALRVLDLLLLLAPDHPGDLRTRATLLSAVGAYRAALADVERCLTLSPHAPDHQQLRWTATALRERVDTLN
jgi:regulator of sirC expression with transglutaminase-like and TPR domain